MSWEVEYTDELGAWWENLTEAEQESIDAAVRFLEACGPNLGFPHMYSVQFPYSRNPTACTSISRNTYFSYSPWSD